MKNGNIPEEDECLYVEQPQYPAERSIMTTLKTAEGSPAIVVDPDAVAMSKQYPSENITVVYHNGIPTVMSVRQLVEEALISIQGKVSE